MTTLDDALTSTSAADTDAARRPATIAEHWLDGAAVPARGSRRLVRTSPVDGSPAGSVTAADDDEVAAAVTGAAAAFDAWRHTPPAERAACLTAAAATIREHAEQLGAALTADTGRLLRTSVESATVAADLLTEAATTGLGPAGRTLAGAPAALDVVRREPHGVVAVLTPWNDPLPAAAGLLAAALVTGNTVVHKPSERSPHAGWLLGRLVAEQLPAGVLQVLVGDGSTGAALVADPRVALVAHIGSSATGRAIAAVAGARGARLLLENGGKDALVVDEDVDPAWAAAQIALGAFTNTGQLCTSVERVYVHERVADAVLDELVRLADAQTMGAPDDDGTELGPLVDELQLAVVAAHVDAAVAAGARCLAGGRRLDRPGAWYPATVLDSCSEEMDVLATETFGPVAAVRRAPDFDTALAWAGSGRYGLAATVLTGSLEHALRAADRLDVGTVKVNAVFGGAPGGSADPRRDSGQGAGYGPDLLAAMTRLKTVHLEAPPR